MAQLGTKSGNKSGGGAGKRILLGRIAGAHGIRGEVLIKTFTERPEDIAAYGPLDDGRGHALRIEAMRPTPRGVVARLAGIADRTAAEALKGASLYVDRERLPAPAEGEFYHADLVGLAAVAPDGHPLGEVVAVHNHGAGDLLELRLAGTGKTELVAFTDAFVPEVDLAARRAVVRLPGAER
ncbi:MAG TPA: ribosome maturation factor RimM [Hyphomicrobiaceae bacterium]|jgi:16S rRNA processing protein RimM